MDPQQAIHSFVLPTRLVLGCGSIQQLPDLAKSLGRGTGMPVPYSNRVGYGHARIAERTRFLLVTGKNSMRKTGILQRVYDLMREQELSVFLYDGVVGESTWDMVAAGVQVAKENECQAVIALGGGSVLDAAKAIAALANKDTPVKEYQQGKPLESPGIPFIAIPTTSGTGAEVTPNAVLIDHDVGTKKSFRHASMGAKVAVIDPQLTLPLSPKITAYSGVDALCQAIEALVSLGANPLTDSLCLGAAKLIGRSLLRAYEKPDDLQAREDMAYGSLMAGIALFNTRLGVVHGIAHPLGVRCSLPHGLLCGILLPHAMEFNMDVVRDKYDELAPLLGAQDAFGCVDKVRDLLSQLDFPTGLGVLGVKEDDFPAIVQASMPSGSLKANPKKVSEEDVRAILKNAL